MGNKDLEDYITDGIYGTKRPKEAERKEFLGTLRERIILALTIGQVMTDSGIVKLEEAMKKHGDSKLLINGQVAYRFLSKEIELANKYDIPYTIVSDEEHETKVGAVLTYDYAINKEEIFINDEEADDKPEENTNYNTKKRSIFSKLKNWLSPPS